MTIKINKELLPEQKEEIMKSLKARFDKNISRHIDFNWAAIQLKLENNPEKLWSLYEMEKTGGEPDIINYDKETNEFIFCDCSAESPIGRRSFCYDREAWEKRKEFKPKNTAMDMASEMGIELLTEAQYIDLQNSLIIGKKLDSKTSSWIKTPIEIRKLGGAIFGDYRFGKVFIYHNGAESYYAGRGFRGLLKV